MYTKCTSWRFALCKCLYLISFFCGKSAIEDTLVQIIVFCRSDTNWLGWRALQSKPNSRSFTVTEVCLFLIFHSSLLCPGGICQRGTGGTCPGHWISRYGTKCPILCWCPTPTRSRPPHWLYLQISSWLRPIFLQCFDAVGWVSERASACKKNLATAMSKRSLRDLRSNGLTWSDLRKIWPDERKLEVVLVQVGVSQSRFPKPEQLGSPDIYQLWKPGFNLVWSPGCRGWQIDQWVCFKVWTVSIQCRLLSLGVEAGLMTAVLTSMPLAQRLQTFWLWVSWQE